MDIQNYLEHLKNLENLQPSDFVYVGLKKNKGSNQVYFSKHLISRPSNSNGGGWGGDQIYEDKWKSALVWPEVEDIGWTSREDIHLFLSVPSIDRRHHFTFNDIDQINVINCCK